MQPAPTLLMRADEVTADEAKWRKIRSVTIGASEIGVLLGIAPQSHGSPYSLYVEKITGERPGESDNDAMARGRTLEPYVAGELARMQPDLVVYPGGMYASAVHPWMTATFDRLAINRAALEAAAPRIGDLAGIGVHGDDELYTLLKHHGAAPLLDPVEMKTALLRWEWGEPGSNDIPGQYLAQAQWQMAVWGPWARRVLVPVQFMQPWETAIYVVERDEADIAYMIAQARAFMDRVERRDPPPIDWTPETSVALRAQYGWVPDTTYTAPATMAARYIAALRSERKAEQRRGKIQNELLARAGGAHRVVIPDPDKPGKELTLFSQSTGTQNRVSVTELREQEPETAKRFEREIPVSRVTPNHRRWTSDLK